MTTTTTTHNNALPETPAPTGQRTTATENTNGVDVGQMNETVKAIMADPEMAKLRFQATNTWINGGHCRSTICNFFATGEKVERARQFVLESDEPPLLLGEDHGPTPTENLLHALAGCLNTSFIYHAAALGVTIEALELELEADMDFQGFLGLNNEVRNGFQSVRVTYKVTADAPEEKIKGLIALVQKRSPVFDIVSNPVPVHIELEMQQA